MASDVGIDILNSIGANKFDVKTMARTLAEADVAAQRANIEKTENKANVQLSGYSTLTQAMSGVQAEIANLTQLSTFQKQKVTSSDTNVMDAKITGNVNNGLYQIQVNTLAKAQTLATNTDFGSTTSTVGTGTLNITVGGATHDVPITGSNNTLSGIQNAINQADIGVNATIVNVGGAYKLMMSSAQTGAGNSISVAVTGDSEGTDVDNLGLSRLASPNLTETVPAQDASLTINGLAVTSSTNVVKGVIDGVELNLKSTDPGVTKTLEIGKDTDGLADGIKNFVEVFNALDSILDQLSQVKKDEENDAVGSLNGDATLRNVRTQIREALFDSLPGLSGSIQSLADVGVNLKLDGTLELDSAKLNTALANSPEKVGQLFAAGTVNSDSLIKFKGSSDKTIEGSYNVTIDQIAEKAEITGASIGAGGDITIDASNKALKVKVNGNESADLVLNEGVYTREDLAKEIARVINGDQAISENGGQVAVEFDATTNTYKMTSEKYGSASKLELVSGSLLTSGVVGLGVTAETAGKDVLGSLEKDGTLYSFTGQGQQVKINSFLDGSPRDLEFEVLGGATGARGTMEFNRGYAAKLDKLFSDLVDKDDGIIGRRVDGLNDRVDDMAEKTKKVDERYNALELRYRLQFGQLQTVLNQMESTRSSLAASLAALQPQKN